ncbi:MAG: hypothetical protein VX993_05650 [Candidatus Neomarinimicrobiota bacterium]|nr:hypothetical protein [Candidatus Neomarinimicrobiota bacterium]
MGNLVQKIIRLMPIILLFMLIFIDRNNKVYVGGFLLLLFLYTIILVTRILYAKKVWHKEFNDKDYANDASIIKMQDLTEKFDK